MAIRLRISAEPSEKLVAVAALSLDLNRASDAQWGDLEAYLQAWLLRVSKACREMTMLAPQCPPGLSLRPAVVAGACEDLQELVSLEAAFELEAVSARSLRAVLDLLDALGRLRAVGDVAVEKALRRPARSPGHQRPSSSCRRRDFVPPSTRRL